MIWIQTLCPGSVRVSCSAGAQQGALLPLTPEISTAQYHTGWTADTSCWSPVTPAALHFLECFGKRLWGTDALPALEGTAKVMNSVLRAAGGLEWAKMNLTLRARGYQKALRMTQCTVTGRQSEHKHDGSMERLPPAQARSQHERCHSTQAELGPSYKGLATLGANS